MNYLQLLAPDFSLILCGFLVCRYTPLDRPLWDKVEALVYFFLFPVLLFHSIARSPLHFAEASSLVAAGLLMGLAAIAFAYMLPYLPIVGGYVDRREHAGAAQVGFRFNSFVALALAERMAGARGIGLIAVLIGVCVPMFNVAAVWPMVRHARAGLARELLRNPLIVATVSGLAANAAGLSIPQWIEPAFSRIGNSSIALGLLAAGAGMHLTSLASNKLLTVWLLAVRHLITPLVAALLARAFGLDAVQTTVLLALSALPTASSAYVLAARMGYNGPYVAGLVTLSTLCGLLSLPFALGVLR